MKRTGSHYSADTIIRKVCPNGHCPSTIVEVDLDDPQSVMRGLATLAEYLTVKRIDTRKVFLMVRTTEGRLKPMAEQPLDWRRLAPGRELDRLIAEKAGWRVDNELHTSPSGNVDPYLLVMPDGEKFCYYKTIDEAWEHLPVGYSTDLNAAITLLDNLPAVWEWEIRRKDYAPHYIILIRHGSLAPELTDWLYVETLKELPYRICQLWLAWQEQNPPTERTFGSAAGQVRLAEDFDVDDIGFDESED